MRLACSAHIIKQKTHGLAVKNAISCYPQSDKINAVLQNVTFFKVSRYVCHTLCLTNIMFNVKTISVFGVRLALLCFWGQACVVALLGESIQVLNPGCNFLFDLDCCTRLKLISLTDFFSVLFGRLPYLPVYQWQ